MENKCFKIAVITSTFLIMLLIMGCCHTPQDVIRDKVITMVPPVIHDTVRTINLDTVIIGQKIINAKDTIAVIKYYPKYQYIDYKIKPDTLRFTVRDTLKQTKIIKEKMPLLSEIGLIGIGLLIGMTIIILIKLKFLD